MSQPQLRENRWLAAIVFIDMVDYSVKMQRSETAAQAAVDALWGIARPIIADQDGVEIRTFGDGMLAIFPGTLAAAHCCLEILEGLAGFNDGCKPDAEVHARASVHLGEITDAGNDIYGDGVNIAARLVDLAPSGGIAISNHVREQIANAIDHPIRSLGHKLLKNIKAPMEVFCLAGPDCTPADLDAAAAAGESPLRRWTFDGASFDEAGRELSVHGKPTPLSREAGDILLYLLRHAGEVVTPEELCESAQTSCPDRIDTLNPQAADCDEWIVAFIEELWTALRDTERRQIQIQPGFGYRLAAGVLVGASPGATLTHFDFKAGDHPPLRPNWSLVEIVGQGGQGEVWRGRHDKTGETRVYKFALDPDKLGALKREITLSRVLHSTAQSEYFIRVLDWNLTRPPFFIECQDGGSDDLLGWAHRQGDLTKVPLPLRLDLIGQIADALAAAHSVGVLHKDLKPANILIDTPDGRSPRIRLTDFGSGGVLDSRYLDDAGVTRMGFTRPAAIIGGSSSGTPMYLAPEILTGQIATVQSDVYALGVMLYQMAVGDLGRPLATGWEADVADELLRDDIAAATQGNPLQRLADAAELATRVRGLSARRRQREQERKAREQALQDRLDAEFARNQLKKLRTRRRWVIAVMAALALGLVLALHQQRQAARAEARAAQASRQAQAVADFLTVDLFSVVGEQPLSRLTVPELLLLAADKLERRHDHLAGVAAQLHLALGNALYKAEHLSAAADQFDAALRAFEAAGQLESPQAVAAAAESLASKQGRLDEIAELLPYYEQFLDDSRKALGTNQRNVLELQRWLAQSHFRLGQWRDALHRLRATVAALDATQATDVQAQRARIRLAEILLYSGRFAEATQLLEQVLASNAENDDPLIESTANAFLARTLIETEDFNRARQSLDDARRLIIEWRLPGMTIVRASIALFESFLALRIGEADRAIALLEPTLAALRDYAPTEINDAVITEFRGWLAQAYSATGQFAAAEAVARSALEAEALLPAIDQNARGQTARVTLAEVLLEAGKYAQAAATVEQVNPDTVSRLGDATPVNARLHRLHGLLALQRGARDEAATQLKASLAAYAASYGPRHSFTRRTRAELARATAP